jgi:hypothetical protein
MNKTSRKQRISPRLAVFHGLFFPQADASSEHTPKMKPGSCRRTIGGEREPGRPVAFTQWTQ